MPKSSKNLLVGVMSLNRFHVLVFFPFPSVIVVGVVVVNTTVLLLLFKQQSKTMNNHHLLDHRHDHNDLLLDQDQQEQLDQQAIDLTFHRIACLQERIRRQQHRNNQSATENYERIMQILEDYRPLQERRQRRHQDLLNRMMARHSATTNNLFGNNNDDDENATHQLRSSTSAVSSKQDQEIEYLAVRSSEELVLEKEARNGYNQDGDDDDDDLICPICVDPLVELPQPPTHEDEENVDNNTTADSNNSMCMPIAVTQKCQHRFHEKCLVEWLKSKNCEENRHCPMCRERITETENMFFVYQRCKIGQVVNLEELEETEVDDELDDEILEEVNIDEDETDAGEDKDLHRKKGKLFHDGFINFVGFWLPVLILIWWSQNWISYWNNNALTA